MKSIFPFLALLIALSCDDSEPRPACAVDNPVEDLPWLADIIEEAEATEYWHNFTYIQQAYYLNQPVFIIGNCCPNCSYIVPVYNCEGVLICYLHDCLDGFLKHEKLIWKSEQSNCTLN